MRFLFGLSLIATALNVQAQKLTEVDIKPGYITVQCANNETDNLGALGLRLNGLTSTQTEDTISLSANSSLFVCSIALDGSKKLSWKPANPFQGFDVQYYDYRSNSIQNRKVFIDPSKPFNRMRLVVLTRFQTPNLSVPESTMKEDSNNSFSGTVVLNKSSILSASDLAKLDQGAVVKRIVELYHSSNFTTIINNEEMLLGDENRSGQNLILHFKKEGQAIRLVKISN